MYQRQNGCIDIAACSVDDGQVTRVQVPMANVVHCSVEQSGVHLASQYPRNLDLAVNQLSVSDMSSAVPEVIPDTCDLNDGNSPGDFVLTGFDFDETQVVHGTRLKGTDDNFMVKLYGKLARSCKVMT